jgi:N-dimethylarginine dimethylaminohydrolase
MSSLELLGRPKYLMCPPDYFRVRRPHPVNGHANDFEERGYQDYITNPRDFRRLAAQQYHNLKQLFIAAGAEVVEMTPKARQADQSYTADPTFSLITCERDLPPRALTILSQFTNRQRQSEVALSKAWFEEHLPDRTIVVSPHAFEGSGDNLYDPWRDQIYSGCVLKATHAEAASGRSDIRAHAFLQDVMGVEVISLKVKKPYFHIDTSTAFLSKGHVLSFEGGLQPDAYAVFHDKAFAGFGMSPREFLIPVSASDARKYACNAQCVNNTVIMPLCSDDLQAAIRKAGYEVVTTDLSAFIAAGGATHCLSNNVNQRRVVGGLHQFVF